MSFLSDTATFRRVTVAASLVTAALTSLAWTALEPPFPDGFEARLTTIDDAGVSAAVSASLFTFSQLPMLAAVLGIAHLIRRGAPVLSNLGGALAVLGTFGHAVFGGVALVTVVMAGDPARRTEYAGLLEDVESSPAMAFAAAGLVGTVLGLLLLSIGLWRSRVVSRWVPVTLWFFLAVEFVGANLSDYASYVAGLSLLVCFVAIAQQVWASPRSDWSTVTTPSPTPYPTSSRV